LTQFAVAARQPLPHCSTPPLDAQFAHALALDAAKAPQLPSNAPQSKLSTRPCELTQKGKTETDKQTNRAHRKRVSPNMRAKVYLVGLEG
jgi:hypothetical protein